MVSDDNKTTTGEVLSAKKQESKAVIHIGLTKLDKHTRKTFKHLRKIQEYPQNRNLLSLLTEKLIKRDTRWSVYQLGRKMVKSTLYE